MNRQRTGFPLIVSVVATHPASSSEALFTALKDVFKKLRERWLSGVLVIQAAGESNAQQVARAATEAGVQFRNISETTDAPKEAMTADIEQVEISDVLLLIS